MASRVQEEEKEGGGGEGRPAQMFSCRCRSTYFRHMRSSPAELDYRLSSCKHLLVCVGAAVRSSKCHFKLKGQNIAEAIREDVS